MGIYSDIRDFIKDLRDDEVLSAISSTNPRKNNISRKAREGTLQFPVLVSRALDIETMSIITKALERNFSSFVQIAFSLNSQFQVTGKNSAVDYIKQFHSNQYIGDLGYMNFISGNFNDVYDKYAGYFENLSNINSIDKLKDLKSSLIEVIESISEPSDIFATKKIIKESLDSCNFLRSEKLTDDKDRSYILECIDWIKHDAINALDERANIIKALKESLGDLSSEYITENLGNGVNVSFSVYDKATTNVIIENKQQLIDVLEDVRHDILNNKYKPSNETVYNFKNKELSSKYNIQHVTEANRKKYTRDEARYRAATFKQNQDKFNYQQQRDTKSDEFNREKFNYEKQKDGVNRFDKYNTIDLNKNMLTDNDVKKSNELVPTMLHVRINTLDKNGANAGIIDFNVGIKAILHPIKSDEMISNIVSASKQGGVIFNFIRWTTGEIKFIKDFLLDINTIKLDVYNKSHGASPWWIALKRRKRLSKFNVLMKGTLLPNATIVISAEEAELIKSNFGFDLYNAHFVEKLIDTYFLLGFVIVDNASQVAHFRFDNGNQSFETIPFSALERENTNSERKFKDMLKVLSRG